MMRRHLLAIFLFVSSALTQQWVRQPVKLLDPADGGTHVAANDRGFSLLRSINSPVSLVAFIGRARSGKSFTLNHLLGFPGAFAVGHSVEPKTKGADLWGSPVVESRAGDNATVLFLDTEGLGSSTSGYDKAMLLFTAMVSSHVVYHLSEYIYQDDVTKLYSIVNLVELYQKKNIRTVDLPPLTWLVQRFNLQTTPAEERAPREELLFGRFLQEKANPANSPVIAEFNETARAVKRQFCSHDVFFIPPAVQDSADCARLTDPVPPPLDPRYVEKMAELKALLLRSPVKRLDRRAKPLTGAELADFAMSILPEVNSGGSLLGDKVIEAVGRQLYASCQAAYEQVMKKIELPVDEEVLSDRHFVARASALATFDEQMIGDAAGMLRLSFRSDLKLAIERTMASLTSMNTLASLDRCSAVLEWASGQLRAKNYAGNLVLFDSEARVIAENATALLRGPKKAECTSRLWRDFELLRETVAAIGLPGRVLRLTKFGATVLIASVIVVYISRFIPPLVPAIVVKLSEITSVLSLLFILLSLWALDGTAAPVSAMTLTNAVESVSAALALAIEHWELVVPGLAALVLLLALFRARSPDSVAAELRGSVSGGRHAVVFVDNAPSIEYLCSVAESLFRMVNTPILAVGWHRFLGLPFMPSFGFAHVCAVSSPADATVCQNWVSLAVRSIASASYTPCDFRANWKEASYVVFCNECFATSPTLPSPQELRRQLQGPPM